MGVVYKVDCIYSIDQNRFKDSIIKKEQYLQKRLELLQLANEKEENAKQLRRKASIK